MQMKRILLAMSAVTALASSGYAASTVDEINEKIDDLKETQEELSAHDGDDNIKWGVDFRTAYDNISYDMADGTTKANDKLYSMRLWLNMAYSPDDNNLFLGQLSVNKAFGADFQNRQYSMGSLFDWTGNEALGNNTLKIRQAYWVYMDTEAETPWSFSVGRRPSTDGFLGNLSQDNVEGSPLAHIVNVEFDAISAKIDLSKVTDIPGFAIKACAGYGSTNAEPLFETATPYAHSDDSLENLQMASVIVDFYNDSRFILKGEYIYGGDVLGQEGVASYTDASGNVADPSSATNVAFVPSGFIQFGNMHEYAISGMIDGITEEGYFSDAKLFGSFAVSVTEPKDGEMMLGSAESEVGTSYWIGTYLPVGEEAVYGTVGLEYNHGDQYWRPFTYAEDTMIGSKIAVRGDAFEVNYTYNITEALSLQARYVKLDYDYSGSQGFFGNYSGQATSIDDIKAGAKGWNDMTGGANPTDIVAIQNLASIVGAEQANQMAGAAQSLPNIVESADDIRFYVRYRF